MDVGVADFGVADVGVAVAMQEAPVEDRSSLLLRRYGLTVPVSFYPIR